ncbi:MULTISPECIES: sugar transferase [Pseudomonadota]|jgi:lipopolysaccharide/colanic/teichoic acid biosynthesis glycosyltransferase|uniref:sugar transferase n=1 Tax=Faucicola osloensis TaxID=34062 RepID=UPI0012F2ED77|nr:MULTISPECIES: sugar transferase [Pseudomonadota]VXB89122.1 Undecaprenyl phosphate N,N'-diacetylbacillosamine 1-phosphate transferase [Enhydrobacter sp. 8BJ]
MYVNLFKNIIDFFIAIIGLIILSPFFLIILFILMLINKGSPFFLQKRPGKNRKIFKIIKFKTMTDRKDAFGNLLPMGERITPFGNFLRKTSLDEMPQLLNIIKGDMSIVGPRPLLEQYLPLYTERQNRRHNVKPGITGWAQINGRNQVTWKEKFEMDIWYVENISFKTDISIMLKTAKQVLLRKDIAHIELAVTPEDFMD